MRSTYDFMSSSGVWNAPAARNILPNFRTQLTPPFTNFTQRAVGGPSSSLPNLTCACRGTPRSPSKRIFSTSASVMISRLSLLRSRIVSAECRLPFSHKSSKKMVSFRQRANRKSVKSHVPWCQISCTAAKCPCRRDRRAHRPS